MLIRKNSKEFKGIRNILYDLADNPARTKLIRLFLVKAGNPLEKKVSIEDLPEGADFYYNLTYDKILGSFDDKDRLLYKSDEQKDLYYFQSRRYENWAETPFELDESLVENLPEFAQMEVKKKKPIGKPQKAESKEKAAVPEKPKEDPDKVLKKRFGLKKLIHFTDTDTNLFDYPGMTKMDVLDYYNRVYEYMEYFIQDRLHAIKLYKQTDLYYSLDSYYDNQNKSQLPEWINKKKPQKERGETEREYYYTPDKDHLFALLEAGVIEIHPAASRWKANNNPEFLPITLKPGKTGFEKASEAAMEARTVLEGCKLPHFIKLSERNGLQILIPLDGKSDFEETRQFGEFVVRLIHLKDFGRVTSLDLKEARQKKKVYLEVLQDEFPGSIIAPYSIIDHKPAALISAPLKWEEIANGVDPAAFTSDTIFKRLDKVGDLFADFRKNTVNATEEYKRLKEMYDFLL